MFISLQLVTFSVINNINKKKKKRKKTEFYRKMIECPIAKVTCIFCRLAETSLIFWGTSKHLAVAIFALTSHCWKSLKVVRNLCCKICSLLWHPFEAWRQRLGLPHQGSRREKRKRRTLLGDSAITYFSE